MRFSPLLKKSLYVVAVSCADQEQAQSIAQQAIEKHLAAATHCWEIQAMYKWDGEMPRHTEWRLEMRTTRVRYHELRDLIQKLHTYETPSIVATRIATGSCAYLDWIRKVVA